MRCLSTGLAVVMLVVGSARAEVLIEMVTVGDPGNPPDARYETPGYGDVDYTYKIGKYEVTNSQYTEFLNAVAVSDVNGLYNLDMGGGWNDIGGISRSGGPGNHAYTVREGRDNRPVNFVSWYDAARFVNWLHNGQPNGPQDATTTEDGAYQMFLGLNIVRKPDAGFWLPSEDEWYKAAYYKGNGTNAGYWNYPTRSDTVPTAEAPPGTNATNGSANYFDGEYVDETYYTTEVGAYDAMPSDSPYGTFDQGGNLWEWNETHIDSDRGIRGGSYSGGDHYFGVQFASSRGGMRPDGPHEQVGFRVAAVPEPSTCALLITSLLSAGICWWWRKQGRVQLS